MNKRISFLLLPLLFISCAPKPAPIISNNEQPIINPLPPMPEPQIESGDNFDETAQKNCIANGGTYQRAGMMGHYMCIMPYKDANKVCDDKSDCIGKCLAPLGAKYNEATKGKCQADSNPFGCYAEINEGKLSAALCVD